MTFAIAKGGRGKTAPYDSKLVRIPTPIENQVSQLANQYRQWVESGGNAYDPPQFLDAQPITVTPKPDYGITELDAVRYRALVSKIHAWSTEAEQPSNQRNSRWHRARLLLAELQGILGNH
jgi:hypothetical protein